MSRKSSSSPNNIKFADIITGQRKVQIFLAWLILTGVILITASYFMQHNIGEIGQYWQRLVHENSKKLQLVTELRSELGYGGMIHNLKNFVLRQEEKYFLVSHEKLGAASSAINHYRNYSRDKTEITALDNISHTLISYRTALDEARKLIEAGVPIREIDQKIKVSDEAALSGLSLLTEKAGEFGVVPTRESTISQFRAAIGYGGLIHNFKNFVLRGEKSLHKKVLEDHKKATRLLQDYESLGLNEIEKKAVESLNKILENYAKAIVISSEPIGQDLPPEDVDKEIFVDDTPAFIALANIEQQISLNNDQNTETVSELIKDAAILIGVFLWLTVGMILFLIWTAISSMYERHRQNILLEVSVKKAEAALTELNFQKHALDEHAIVSISDVKGNITYANDKFCQISSYSREELIGQNHRILKSDIYPPEFFRKLWKTISSGKVWKGEIKNKTKQGGAYWVMTTIVPFMNDQGKPFQYVSIRTDISMQKYDEVLLSETNLNLEATKALAEKASQAKSEFLANMSHEIRTPMNAIIGMSKLACDTSLATKKQDFIEKVHHSAKLLLGILNDILDFSKIEAGKLDIETIDFRLQSVLDHLNNIIGFKALEHGLELKIKVDQDVPEVLRGDPFRLGQILNNLGTNAIKFTQQGRITVNVKLDKKLKDGVVLHFCVSDTGIGITQEQQSRLFQSFSQADSSTSRHYGGTGLGLVICKRLIELMGGKIWIESELGEGAHIHFTLQLEEGDPDTVFEKPVGPPKNLDHLSGARILLVEDNELNQELAMELLSSNGIIVTHAWNGKEALNILQKDNFDGILMDIQMPIMDGYNTTREIRKQSQFKELPIIAMTANVMESDQKKAIAVGMNDHIGKPLDEDDLLNSLAKWITLEKPLQAHLSPPLPPSTESGSVSSFKELISIDTGAGLRIAKNRPKLYRKMLTMFCNSSRNFVEDFLTMQQRDDSDGITRAAHNLKGTAATIGATTLQLTAEELEAVCEGNGTSEEIAMALKKLEVELEPVIAELDEFLDEITE